MGAALIHAMDMAKLTGAVCDCPNAPKNTVRYAARPRRAEPSEVLLALGLYTIRIFMDFF